MSERAKGGQGGINSREVEQARVCKRELEGQKMTRRREGKRNGVK